MRRFLRLMMVCAIGLTAIALTSSPAFAQAQNPGAASTSREEVPRRFVPQNSPCVDQPRSYKELADSFEKGRRPLASETTGSWVEIGDLTDPPGKAHSLNCTGERRGGVFEFVLIASGYSLELHAVGMTYPQTVRMKPDSEGSVEFPVDFSGDEGPDTYRCRLTRGGTLACLIGAFTGVEFKKMAVEEGQIYEVNELP